MAGKPLRTRRSSLVTTFGVGSMYPAEDSSFLVMGLHEWDDGKLPSVFEPRLARQLRVRDLKEPPATPEDRIRPSVPIARFPRVLICSKCRALGTPRQLRAALEKMTCGLCEGADGSGRLSPARFVVACKAGHLSDFPFYQWAHPGAVPTQWISSEYPLGRPEDAPADAHVLRLRATGRTSSLGDLVVECSCGARRTLEGIFSVGEMRRHHCRGERPWLGPDHLEVDCGQVVTTMQRGASNVWFSAEASSIFIPKWSGPADEIVRRERDILNEIPIEGLRAIIDGASNPFVDTLLKTRYKSSGVSSSVLAQRTLLAIHPLESEPLTEEQFRYEEFHAIVKDAEERPEKQFVSVGEKVPDTARSWIDVVRRLSRLREVRALYGFTRVQSLENFTDKEGAEVTAPLRPEDDPSSWLPATELLGEGLFIGLDRARLSKWARTPFARQRKAQLDANGRASAGRRGSSWDPEGVDIVRVAVHTLAHIIIDQLALEAGYPASSLRERLYVGEKMAGFLVYTATTGSAGSLGGVSAMADPTRLGPAIEETLARLAWCSADPVCIESTGNGTDGANLAACHNCVLLPETSCETFNIHLDRGLVFGTPEEPDSGFVEYLRQTPGSGVAEPTTFDMSKDIGDPRWRSVWDELPELRPLIRTLVEEEVEVPRIGIELGAANEPMLLTWDRELVTLAENPTPESVEELEELGWTVISTLGVRAEDLFDEVFDALR